MKFLLAFGFLFSALVLGDHNISLLRLASQTVDDVWERLGACGLLRENAYSPNLPRPSVPADDAVVTKNGRLMAYYFEDLSSRGLELEFKNPNGGFPHTVTYTRNSLTLTTPYGGTVAQVTRFFSSHGPHDEHFCRSRPVSAAGFRDCVAEYYVKVIERQLCR